MVILVSVPHHIGLCPEFFPTTIDSAGKDLQGSMLCYMSPVALQSNKLFLASAAPVFGQAVTVTEETMLAQCFSCAFLMATKVAAHLSD